MKSVFKKYLFAAIVLTIVMALIPLFCAQSAGIVPCGGPGQTDCNICWFFVLTRQVMDFLIFQAATIFAAIGLAIAGFMFLLSGSNPGRYETGKTIATNVFKGYLIMLAGWLFINTFFMVFGVAEWSGLKDGWWKIKASCFTQADIVLGCGDGLVTGEEDCDPQEAVAACQGRTGETTEGCADILERCDKTTCKLVPKADCGDGVVQPKNGEECDPAETVADCVKRSGNSNIECENILERCDKSICKLEEILENQCSDEKDKLGLGCYLDEDGNNDIGESECKKGKYVCIPSTKKLKCVNVFGDAEYTKAVYQTDVYKPKDDYTGKDDFYVTDYCCANMMAEYADGKIGDKPFTIVRATPDVTTIISWGGVEYSYAAGTFNCDEVCKKDGKICVGIGLTDPSKNACVYQIHDMAVRSDSNECNNPDVLVISMGLSGNLGRNNCKAKFMTAAYYNNKGQRVFCSFDKYEFFCDNARNYNKVPNNSCGVCKPRAAAGEKCTETDYKQDASDSCNFHANTVGETACYCY